MSNPVSPRFAQLRIKHLALLDVIARSGSLRQAASELCLTQPAITAMLKVVEDSFGCPLVERDSQGARLTGNGQEIRERMRIVLNNLSAVDAELEAPDVRRHLRVGVLASMAIQIVPDAVALLRQTHPEISFSFEEDTVGGMTQRILDERLDCAVGRFDSAVEVSQLSVLETTLICDMALQVACAHNHPLHRRHNLSLMDLRDQDWILAPRGSRGREAFDQGFLLAGLMPPSPRVESISFYSNFQLAARTDMLTMSTVAAVGHYTRLGVIRPLELVWPATLPPMMFFCRKESLQLEAVRSFRKALVDSRPDESP